MMNLADKFIEEGGMGIAHDLGMSVEEFLDKLYVEIPERMSILKKIGWLLLYGEYPDELPFRTVIDNFEKTNSRCYKLPYYKGWHVMKFLNKEGFIKIGYGCNSSIRRTSKKWVELYDYNKNKENK